MRKLRHDVTATPVSVGTLIAAWLVSFAVEAKRLVAVEVDTAGDP